MRKLLNIMANKSETLSFRVPDSVYDEVYQVAKLDRRKLSEVALGLLERGLAAYKRDGQIFEVVVPIKAMLDDEKKQGRKKA
jgi:hypothetical protein